MRTMSTKPAITRLIAAVSASVALVGSTACHGGAADTAATGTWTGQAGSPDAQPVGVRVVFTEQAGSLSGQMFIGDPETSEFLLLGDVSGSRTGSSVRWNTFGLIGSGTIDGNSFSGTLQFPAIDGPTPLVATLDLKR